MLSYALCSGYPLPQSGAPLTHVLLRCAYLLYVQDGETPLILAVKGEHAGVVEALLEAGAHRAQTTSVRGTMCCDCAALFCMDEIVSAPMLDGVCALRVWCGVGYRLRYRGRDLEFIPLCRSSSSISPFF